MVSIPVTLPIISLLTTPFANRHPHTHTVNRSLTSIDIQRCMDDLSLDVGVTAASDRCHTRAKHPSPVNPFRRNG